jgi:hypothetical protein
VTPTAAGEWLARHPLTPSEVDCVIAVMLKILDGKCRMAADEKTVMAGLYDALAGRCGDRLGAAEHELIDGARADGNPALREAIYERRVLAETMISRPVMKAFKAMLREESLLSQPVSAEVDGDT